MIDITFVDTKDLSETLLIIGNEYVRLEIGTIEESVKVLMISQDIHL